MRSGGKVPKWFRSLPTEERIFWILAGGLWFALFLGCAVWYWSTERTANFEDAVAAIPAFSFLAGFYSLWIILPARILFNVAVQSRRRPKLEETLACVIALAALVFMISRTWNLKLEG